MSERTKLVFGVIGLALLCGATYLLVKNNEGKIGVTDDAPQISYVNSHGFTYMYDGQYSLVELSDRYQHVERAGSEPNELVSINVEQPYDGDQYDSFQDFLHTRAILYCAADGPSESLQCTQVTRTQPFTTATGISGEVFYLELEHSSPDGVTHREAGPFYGFDVTREGGAMTALLIFPTHFYNESDLYDEGAEEANDIVNTVRLVR